MMTSLVFEPCVYNEFDALIARPAFTAEHLGISTPAVIDPTCGACRAMFPRTPRPQGTSAQQAATRLADASLMAATTDLATDQDSAMAKDFARERAWAHTQALKHADRLAPFGELLMALTTDPAAEPHLYASRPGQARWALVRVADMLQERRQARHKPHGGFDPTAGDGRWLKAYRHIVATSLWAGPDSRQIARALSEADHGGRSEDHTAAELACYVTQPIWGVRPTPRGVAEACENMMRSVVQMLVTRASVLNDHARHWS
jgi:hypothetical protein